MKKPSSSTNNASDSSKKVLGIDAANYCFVRYSEIEDLRRSANDASIALSRIAKLCADIKLMSMRNGKWTTDELLQKLMDTSVTRPSTRLVNRISEVTESNCDTDKELKFTDLPLPNLHTGRKKRLHKR